MPDWFEFRRPKPEVRSRFSPEVEKVGITARNYLMKSEVWLRNIGLPDIARSSD